MANPLEHHRVLAAWEEAAAQLPDSEDEDMNFDLIQVQPQAQQAQATAGPAVPAAPRAGDATHGPDGLGAQLPPRPIQLASLTDTAMHTALLAIPPELLLGAPLGLLCGQLAAECGGYTWYAASMLVAAFSAMLGPGVSVGPGPRAPTWNVRTILWVVLVVSPGGGEAPRFAGRLGFSSAGRVSAWRGDPESSTPVAPSQAKAP